MSASLCSRAATSSRLTPFLLFDLEKFHGHIPRILVFWAVNSSSVRMPRSCRSASFSSCAIGSSAGAAGGGGGAGASSYLGLRLGLLLCPPVPLAA